MEHVVGEAAATLPYTVALHASTRILTFVLNSILLRLVTHDVLGLANVRLQLLYTTIAFISREPFRRALPAGENLENNETRKLNSRNWAIVRTNWLCPLLAVTVGLPLTAVWIYLLEEPPEKFASTYYISTFLYALAAFAEAMGEPACAAAHLGANFRLRMKSEGMAVGVRTVLTVSFVWFWAPHGGQAQTCVGCELYGFALAQFLSSAIYSAWMWLSTIPLIRLSNSEHLKSASGNFFEPTYLRLSVSFLAHSIVKQLLTEGERYVMTATGLLTFAQQGVYDVVNNLGSLVARLVFLPLEDTAYLVFCQMLDRKHQSSAADLHSKSVVLLTRTLSTTLKASLLVGVACAVFGWLYSDIVLVTYAGTAFVEGSEAIPLLRFFCVYTIFLAANGITESFVMAGMSQQDLDWHNLFDVGVSIVYTGATIFLANRYGSVGFIYANMFNMFCRIGHSVHWIDSFYGNTNFTPLRSSLPSSLVFVCLALVSVFAAILNSICPAILCRFACCGALGLLSLVVFYFAERSHLRYIYELVSHKRRSEDDEDNKEGEINVKDKSL